MAAKSKVGSTDTHSHVMSQAVTRAGPLSLAAAKTQFMALVDRLDGPDDAKSFVSWLKNLFPDEDEEHDRACTEQGSFHTYRWRYP